jgi:hypothetical protein
MFRSYQYCHPHPFEELHGFVSGAMELICRSTTDSSFEKDILDKLHPEFKALVNEESKNKSDYLYKPMEKLFHLIKGEPPAQKLLLLKAIKENNEIEDICQTVSRQLISYEEITNKTLRKELLTFLNNLYEGYLNRSSFIRYATRRAREMGLPETARVDFKHHFDSLVTNSQMRVCPFCGMGLLLNKFNDGRNAYDHFLPKGTIPFVSVNFRNLAPMCDECNSKNKLAKVPVCKQGDINKPRVKAFYPFAKQAPVINIGFEILNEGKSWDELLLSEINLIITTAQIDEAESWKNTFCIESRYKAQALGSINTWLDSLRIEYAEDKKDYPQIKWKAFIDKALRTYQSNRYVELNFLKYALLKCLMKDNELIRLLEAYEKSQLNLG